MSYILDALKKTESEQDPVAAANLALGQQRVHSRLRTTGILVVAALLANAVILLWLFGPLELTTRNAPEDASHQAAAVTAPVPTPSSRPDLIPAEKPPTAAAVQPPSQPSPRIRTQLAGLPAVVRERFPGLVFSTHIYAEDPTLRAVVANGQRLVEGDKIDAATLQRITEDGVILAFENYLVEIPVVGAWD
jgi:general secretion pathway protein B